jgi:drug/metabolite transporter (DMT)-like permease
VGIVLGMLAVVMVSRTPQNHRIAQVPPRIVAMALVAGIGFGAYFICLARTPQSSGAWPLVISRFTSALLIVPLARGTGNASRIGGRLFGLAAITGVFDGSANLFFLLSSRHGHLALASVLTSLYPAATVLLAVGLLHERTGRLQRVGLGLAAVAVVLITA